MMVSRKSRTTLKQVSDAAVSQPVKSGGKRHGTASHDCDEDALEMDRNFNLLSKRNKKSKVETDRDEISAWESEESVRHNEPAEKGYRESRSDMAASSETDDTDNEGGSRALDGNETKVQTKDKFKRDMSTLSFEEIMSLQNKVGTKAYNKIISGPTKKKQTAQPVKQLTKHRPHEISAKKQVPFLRRVASIKTNISRDPRFDDMSGEFKQDVFNQTYQFINDIKHQESEIVGKMLRKAKSNEKREEIKALLTRMENQEDARKRQDHQKKKELQFKLKQRELVGHGHKPFYLKKSLKKKLELAEKYNDLKKSGKLKHFLSKKRKRNALKDRRKLPSQHK